MQAIDELERFLDRRTTEFVDVLMHMARRNWFDRDATENLARLIQRTQILADLHGRKRMLMEADALREKSAQFAAGETPIVPGVPFVEAIEDLLSREPRLAESAAEVSRLYSWGKVFALARSASINLTRRVQAELSLLLAEGKGAERTREELQNIAADEAHDWTVAYASTVYRTNVSNAYNIGRIEQAKADEVREIVPALEYVTMEDERVRPNHWAANGFLAPVDDPAWRTHRPPQGFQCRCSLRHVSVFELQRRGLIHDGQVVKVIPAGFDRAHPDEGFTPGLME